MAQPNLGAYFAGLDRKTRRLAEGLRLQEAVEAGDGGVGGGALMTVLDGGVSIGNSGDVVFDGGTASASGFPNYDGGSA